nr:hypothetical protein Iba_chr12bCG7430 [Ipomoea batatas]
MPKCHTECVCVYIYIYVIHINFGLLRSNLPASICNYFYSTMAQEHHHYQSRSQAVMSHASYSMTTTSIFPRSPL